MNDKELELTEDETELIDLLLDESEKDFTDEDLSDLLAELCVRCRSVILN